MGRLGTLAIITLLLGWSSVSKAEPPAAAPPSEDSVAPQPSPPKRQEPPAPPRDYLVAGTRLFNKSRFELAGKYLQAAEMFRDRLTESEQIVLDVYREKLDEYHRSLMAAQNPVQTPKPFEEAATQALDPGVVPASNPASMPADVLRPLSGSTELEASPERSVAAPKTESPGSETPPHFGLERGPVYGSESWRDTASSKEKARWLLKLAREQIFKGHFDAATRAIDEAKAMNVKWTVFEETPEKMTEALENAKTKKAKETTSPLDVPHDRQTAKSRLRSAREALAANELDQAESIAREVKGWKVGFNLFDDTPDKVAAAVADVRRRLAIHNAEMSVRTYRPTEASTKTSDPSRPVVPMTEPLPSSPPPRGSQ